ncbi:hypothetical protein B0T25DRAFT_548550 [Lasiosphaeria hispida]|uniref:Uncharacterized protein n=1 Tax=Lasiosphaeria hispida TaxID=260671 RepID=A0AAJ0HFB3_9PEZI|nr:hypothetical protein B0T25DRAFT_548550 [Lasiosphaeria hispida]
MLIVAQFAVMELFPIAFCFALFAIFLNDCLQTRQHAQQLLPTCLQHPCQYAHAGGGSFCQTSLRGRNTTGWPGNGTVG